MNIYIYIENNLFVAEEMTNDLSKSRVLFSREVRNLDQLDSAIMSAMKIADGGTVYKSSSIDDFFYEVEESEMFKIRCKVSMN